MSSISRRPADVDALYSAVEKGTGNDPYHLKRPPTDDDLGRGVATAQQVAGNADADPAVVLPQMEALLPDGVDVARFIASTPPDRLKMLQQVADKDTGLVPLKEPPAGKASAVGGLWATATAIEVPAGSDAIVGNAMLSVGRGGLQIAVAANSEALGRLPVSSTEVVRAEVLVRDGLGAAVAVALTPDDSGERVTFIGDLQVDSRAMTASADRSLEARLVLSSGELVRFTLPVALM